MVTISDKVFSISDEAYEMVLHTIERSGLDPWLDNFTDSGTQRKGVGHFLSLIYRGHMAYDAQRSEH